MRLRYLSLTSVDLDYKKYYSWTFPVRVALDVHTVVARSFGI